MAEEALTHSSEIVHLPALNELNVSGVYFLWRNGIVVYVGQANHVRRRLGEHISEGAKEFDAISVIACPMQRADTLERRYIEWLVPRYNHCSLAKTMRSLGVVGAEAGLTPEDYDRSMTYPAAARYLGLSLTGFRSLRRMGLGPHPRRVPRRPSKAYWAQDLRRFAADHPELIEQARSIAAA